MTGLLSPPPKAYIHHGGTETRRTAMEGKSYRELVSVASCAGRVSARRWSDASRRVRERVNGTRRGRATRPRRGSVNVQRRPGSWEAQG